MHQPQIVEYKNMRVLTTQQLADSYRSSTDTITKNFNRNKDRYIEGKHYMCLKGDELRSFRATGQIDLLPNVHTLYLWTQKGTLLHAKSLNIDVAWEVYGRLVDNYFSKATALDVSQLSQELQMFKQLFTTVASQQLEQKRIAAEQKQQAEQLNRIEQKQETIIETFVSASDYENFRDWANRCISRIAESPKFDKGIGINANYAFARNESYERLKSKWKCNLEDRVSRAKGRALQRNPGISKTELESINKLTIISTDKSLRPVYETVLKEMMIAYCVDIKTNNR